MPFGRSYEQHHRVCDRLRGLDSRNERTRPSGRDIPTTRHRHRAVLIESRRLCAFWIVVKYVVDILLFYFTEHSRTLDLDGRYLMHLNTCDLRWTDRHRHRRELMCEWMEPVIRNNYIYCEIVPINLEYFPNLCIVFMICNSTPMVRWDDGIKCLR